MASSPCLFQFLLSFSVIAHAAACAAPGCQLLSPCSGAEECAPGLYCGTCPASGKTRPSCTRGQATRQTDIEKGLPFNKYTWLVTHNSFSIVNSPSFTGVQRVTFYNQEDTVTNQLLNGVRGLMLDMYDFEGDIWLCHSFQGQCYNFTAFEPAINTLKEVEAFLTNNPTEIVTIFIEDYVRTPKGLSSLFTNADLMKYLYPLAEMPTNGKDWPTITEMAEKNYRLLVFTSVASKEADEGIAYQWRYVLENEPGDPGILPGSCPNRRESQLLTSRYASLFLQNYFPTIPVQNDACKEHSSGLAEMVDACYKAAEKLMPNFLSVNFYLRSDGRGVFDILDRMNGLTLCGCPTVFACKPGAPFGVCKNISSSSSPTRAGDHGGGTYAGYVEFSGFLLRRKSFSFMEMNLFYCSMISILISCWVGSLLTPIFFIFHLSHVAVIIYMHYQRLFPSI
ncbi:PI-PLC X domain-containing protein At5g67130 isoform X2 [Dendrobium catenatum]|uniref:PI-PLC X domain-containing protein n=1 Tax=Dendrobium catenatum TaxID=906689 RepID=A0A2I0VXW5_9ASPA|nr:PI-PLC X domain-containing protein At5g67130 isoform X2 [Dendrobium catenatum]PKU68255.1 PI-PLC X domain-containing protein [Dendrobium catenatum]